MRRSGFVVSGRRRFDSARLGCKTQKAFRPDGQSWRRR